MCGGSIRAGRFDLSRSMSLDDATELSMSLSVDLRSCTLFELPLNVMNPSRSSLTIYSTVNEAHINKFSNLLN